MITFAKSTLSQKLVTNSFIMMAVQLVGPGGSFLFWALAARIMSTEELGLASSIIAAASFLSSAAQLGIGFGLFRYLPHARNPVRLMNLAMQAVGLVSAAFALVFVLGTRIWSPALTLLSDHLSVTLVFLTLIVSYSLLQLVNTAFLVRRLPILMLCVNSTQSALSILLFLALSFWLESYWAVTMAYLLSFVASLGLALLAFLPRSEPGFRVAFMLPRRLWTPFSRYALANHAAQQLITAPGNLMTLVAVNILGPGTSGFFFIAWTIVQGVSSLAASVAYSLLAEGSNRPQFAATFTRQALKLGLLLATGFMLFILLVSKPLLALYGPEYVQIGLTPLRVLAVSIIPTVVIAVFFNALRVHAAVRALMVAALIWCATSLLTTIVFMWQRGINGAAFGWVLSQVLFGLLIVTIGRKRAFPAGAH